MEFNKKIEGKKLTIAPKGRVDTLTTPELESEILNSIEGMTDFVLDFKEVPYISSACLRVILLAQKHMNKVGFMSIINTNDLIKDIFHVSGFDKIINIK